jgi:hypothetical protein
MKSHPNIARPSPETRARQLRLLEVRGWRRLGADFWLSPYSGFRFDMRGALDVETLRGSFKSGWERQL